MNIDPKVLIQSRKALVAISSITGFGVGAGTAYLLLNRRLSSKYAAISEQEIEEAKRFYSAKYKTGEFADPTSLAEQIVDLGYVADGSDLRAPDFHPIETLDEEDVEVVEDLVEVVKTARVKDAKSANSYFDYDEEIPKRTDDAPYIITFDEFDSEEAGFSQTSITYFEGDDILVDKDDQPILNSDDLVGDANLQRFGHGSKDNNILYIRNPVLDLEFEVVRSKKKYTQEILGYVEHSDKSGIRRMRRDDG